MNKQEALAVLHEIVDVLKDSALISGVILDYCVSNVSKNPDKVGSYQIKMKCDLDNYIQDCLKPLLRKHNLSLKEDKGFIIVVSS